MDHSLAEVFDRHFEHVKFNEALARKIFDYQNFVANKNQEHTLFFGSNLLGVYVVRLIPRDVMRFFTDYIRVDYANLERDIRKLTTIYHENSISGDILNLTLMYLIHRFYTTPIMPDKKRLRACFDVALIFCFRTVIALTNNYFSWPADPKVAQAAYAALSNQNLIKKLGSWRKLCEYRAEAMVDPKGLNYDRLVLFNDDIVVTSVIQDSQGRFKSVFSIYYDKFDEIHSSGESIGVTSSTIVDVDGDVVLREKTKGVEPLINYARSVMNDPFGLIKSDLVTVVVDMNTNSSYRMIRSSLEWMSVSYATAKWNKPLDKFVTDVIIQSCYYIDKHVPINHRKDYPYILKTLKDLYLSTRSTDPALLSIREQGEKIVRQAYKDSLDPKEKKLPRDISDALVSATRTAIILYIMLRTMTGYRN